MTAAPRLVLILGDQLSPGLSALREAERDRDIVVMAEVWDEARYVPHHPRKIAFLFSAMRHFAEELREAGWQVVYTRLDHADNPGSLEEALRRAVAAHGAAGVILTEPGEYRLKSAAEGWKTALGVPVTLCADDRFLAPHQVFRDWAAGRKQLRMEYFYREMRRRTGLLMNGDSPEGGRWNYDAENRKPPRPDLFMPQPHDVAPDAITSEVLDLVAARFGDHFGRLHPFRMAVTRAEAEAAFEHFITHALPRFGDFQDAMLTGAPYLYHAVIAPYLNAGLLDPLALCRRAERAWHEGAAPLNAVEGFIRQILGWREFIRGIYWLRMPGYTAQNHLGATRPLPAFYWGAATDMACMAAAIGQTRDLAYAHHIQRLMVTGNFALLAGIDPHALHEWYLAVYADAYEWVEAPNTIGMSQFADGGLVASKPYAASGNYINRMSDYCAGCRYDVRKKTGPGACPFNPLYWDFLIRNLDRLGGNPRLAQVYRTWDRMAPETRDAYRSSAAAVLARLDRGDRL